MKLYRNAEGKWVGTQAEAGNKEAIEVPTDKPGLLEWLNANCSSAQVDRQQPVLDTDTSSVHSGITADQALGKCPKCKLTKAGAERIAEGMKLDAICERIQYAQGNEIIRLTEAVVDRQQDFLKGMKS